jgi:hypothetical protein
MVMSFFGITGFAMLLGSGNPHIQYAGTFLGAMGIYPCIPNTISSVHKTFALYVIDSTIDGPRTTSKVSTSAVSRWDSCMYLPSYLSTTKC